MYSDSQFAEIWAEEAGRLHKCKHEYNHLTSTARSSCFEKAKAGCQMDVNPNLPADEINTLRKVKILMQEILNVCPGIKTLFAAKNYPAYLEG